ncbi:MAG: hypothetical protein ABEJ72_03275, partial [Candidatus Aenigmatarchaeota archaeon]
GGEFESGEIAERLPDYSSALVGRTLSNAAEEFSRIQKKTSNPGKWKLLNIREYEGLPNEGFEELGSENRVKPFSENSETVSQLEINSIDLNWSKLDPSVYGKIEKSKEEVFEVFNALELFEDKINGFKAESLSNMDNRKAGQVMSGLAGLGLLTASELKQARLYRPDFDEDSLKEFEEVISHYESLKELEQDWNI